MLKISPSMLASDFGRLEAEAAAMEKAGADMLHLDIMDGHFVPNISFGPPVVASIRKAAGIIMDAHLMISDPAAYIGAFVKAGSDMITFHLESESDPIETIRAIKSHGIRCGLAIKPKTPADAVRNFLPELDMVLVMTVEPGFGGQKFMADMLPKIEKIRGMAEALRPSLDIQVDGGIDADTAALVVKAGANVLVAGTALFSRPDYSAAIKEFRACAD